MNRPSIQTFSGSVFGGNGQRERPYCAVIACFDAPMLVKFNLRVAIRALRNVATRACAAFGSIVRVEIDAIQPRTTRNAVVVYLFGCVFDLWFVAYPQIQEVIEAKAVLAVWPMQESLRSALGADLNWLIFYVVVAEVAKWAIFAAWVLIGILTLSLVRLVVELGLRRVSWHPVDLPRDKLKRLERDAYRFRRIEVRVLYMVLIAIVFLLHFVVFDGIEPWLPILGIVTFCMAEAWAFWRQIRAVQELNGPQRRTAFAWLVKNGWHDFFGPVLGVIVMIYFLAPSFYVATLGLLKTAIYPLINGLHAEYSKQLLETVLREHTVGLAGDIALVIPDFAILYSPTSGLGELWRASVPTSVPYALPALMALFLFRVALPWAFSYDDHRKLLRVVMLFVAWEAINKGFEYAIEHWLGFPVHSTFWLDLVPAIFASGFALLVDQSLKEKSISCPNKACGEFNPSDASFCSKCGKPLKAESHRPTPPNDA